VKKNSLPFKFLGIAAGIVFIVVGYKEKSQFAHIKSVGKTAIVDPIDSYTEHRQGGNYQYYAEFTFITDSGTVIKQKHKFPKEVIEDFKNGRPVNVLFDPKNPSDFIFEKDKSSSILIWCGVFLGIVSIFA
jgi:hypothetical protein